MKRIPTFILLALISAATARAQEPFMSKSLSAESIRNVYARTSGGEISVSGVNPADARIEVYVTPSRHESLSKEEIRQRLDEYYDFRVSAENGKLTAVAEPKDFKMNWKRSLNISYKIYVPENVSADLRTSGGGIALTNLSGDLDFSTSGGGLQLEKLSGKIHGRTSGGGISVTDARDNIDLSTSGGEIKASNCRGTIKLNTSGGPIKLEDLNGNIEASTSGGGVRGNNISGELVARTSGGSVVLRDLACSVEAHTSGGNIEVAINELGKYVKVSNSGGNIDLEVPGNKGLDLALRAERIRISDLNNFSGQQDEHKVTGKVNGGGVPVEVRTSGSITVALK